MRIIKGNKRKNDLIIYIIERINNKTIIAKINLYINPQPE
jgi:hypothetical protein